MDYLNELTAQLGISLWLIIIMIIWSSVWKFLALWKSARKGHVAWFVVFALVNTIGILEILYIYIFSDKTCCKANVKKKPVKQIKKKK